MAKGIPNENYTIRSNWPDQLKDDCTYCNITLKELGEEASISRYRIGQISNGLRDWVRREDKYRELTSITLAFNRIVAGRIRDRVVKGWLYQK